MRHQAMRRLKFGTVANGPRLFWNPPARMGAGPHRNSKTEYDEYAAACASFNPCLVLRLWKLCIAADANTEPKFHILSETLSRFTAVGADAVRSSKSRRSVRKYRIQNARKRGSKTSAGPWSCKIQYVK